MSKPVMDPKPSNHLKSWREFRGLTQEELAAKVGTTAAVISLLENGQRGLSATWLQRFAPHLQVSPGFLLDHSPGDLAADMLEAWASVPKKDQARALAALRQYSARSSGN
ncbi:MAG: helix-turn-helix transcriptional regulator [Pseudomonadota bacterium]